MTPHKIKKVQIVLFVATLVVLGTIWAINGYDNTWLFLLAALIAAPTNWWYKGDK